MRAWEHRPMRRKQSKMKRVRQERVERGKGKYYVDRRVRVALCGKFKEREVTTQMHL